MRTEKKRAPISRAMVPIAILAVVVGLEGFGLLGSDPGPTDEEVESALEDEGATLGISELTVDCPDDAAETEVDARLECTIATPAGTSAQVTVMNHEDEFEWSRQPFFELARGAPGP